MSEETAFLQAFLEAPNDDVLRLVYADWLEDRGVAECSARAEFLRIQVRLGGLGKGPERAALEERLVDLLAVHGKSWSQRAQEMGRDYLGDDGFVLVWWTGKDLLEYGNGILAPHPWLFRVGFEATAVQCENEAACRALMNGPFLRLVRNLDVGSISCELAEAIARSPLLNLVELSLYCRGADAHGEDMVALALAANPALGRLKRIRLEHPSVTDKGIVALAASTSLTGLTDLELEYHCGLGWSEKPQGWELTDDEVFAVWARHRGDGFLTMFPGD
jgi:uncharacterized protein (TIGR02996 family)